MTDAADLAAALAHSLRTAQAGDASLAGQPERLQRRISSIAEQEASSLRAALVTLLLRSQPRQCDKRGTQAARPVAKIRRCRSYF